MHRKDQRTIKETISLSSLIYISSVPHSSISSHFRLTFPPCVPPPPPLMICFDLFSFVIWVNCGFLLLFFIWPFFVCLFPFFLSPSAIDRHFFVPLFMQTASDSCAHHPSSLRAMRARHKRHRQSSIYFSSLCSHFHCSLL